MAAQQQVGASAAGVSAAGVSAAAASGAGVWGAGLEPHAHREIESRNNEVRNILSTIRPASTDLNRRRAHRGPRRCAFSGARAAAACQPDGVEALRQRLLDLHRALIEAERIELERTRGRLTATELWHLLIEDPALAWLGALSSLIVRFDEALADAALDPAELAAEVRALLTPDPEGHDFHRRYRAVLHARPEVVLAHRAVMHAAGARG